MPQGPALVIDVSALQFGLLRLGQRATNSIQIRNVSQLPATWSMKESRVCLQERQEGVSPAMLVRGATPPTHPHHTPPARSRVTRVVCEPWNCCWCLQSVEAGRGNACLVTFASQSPPSPVSRQSGSFLQQNLTPNWIFLFLSEQPESGRKQAAELGGKLPKGLWGGAGCGAPCRGSQPACSFEYLPPGGELAAQTKRLQKENHFHSNSTFPFTLKIENIKSG